MYKLHCKKIIHLYLEAHKLNKLPILENYDCEQVASVVGDSVLLPTAHKSQVVICGEKINIKMIKCKWNGVPEVLKKSLQRLN